MSAKVVESASDTVIQWLSYLAPSSQRIFSATTNRGLPTAASALGDALFALTTAKS